MRRSLAELVSMVARQRDHGLAAVAQPLNLVQDTADLAVRPRNLRGPHSTGSSMLERFHGQAFLLTHRSVVGLAQDEPVRTIIALEPSITQPIFQQGSFDRRRRPDSGHMIIALELAKIAPCESSECAAPIPAKVVRLT